MAEEFGCIVEVAGKVTGGDGVEVFTAGREAGGGGREREGGEVDGEETRDGGGDARSVAGSGDDGDEDGVEGEKTSDVDHGDEVALSHPWDQDEVRFVVVVVVVVGGGFHFGFWSKRWMMGRERVVSGLV